MCLAQTVGCCFTRTVLYTAPYQSGPGPVAVPKGIGVDSRAGRAASCKRDSRLSPSVDSVRGRKGSARRSVCASRAGQEDDAGCVLRTVRNVDPRSPIVRDLPLHGGRDGGRLHIQRHKGGKIPNLLPGVIAEINRVATDNRAGS